MKWSDFLFFFSFSSFFGRQIVYDIFHHSILYCSLVWNVLLLINIYLYVRYIFWFPNNFIENIWNIEWDFFDQFNREKSRRKCGTDRLYYKHTKRSMKVSVIFISRPPLLKPPWRNNSTHTHHNTIIPERKNPVTWRKSYYGNRTLFISFFIMGKLCPSK